jgi:GxxExxY protein
VRFVVKEVMGNILYKDESYAIIGACMEVFNDKGHGFLEAVYQECVEIEFGLRGIPFTSQGQLEISYKGQVLKQRYVPDFICFNTIIVELKAVKDVAADHRAQVFNYLKATELCLALLVNFGHCGSLEWERIVL